MTIRRLLHTLLLASLAIVAACDAPRDAATAGGDVAGAGGDEVGTDGGEAGLDGDPAGVDGAEAGAWSGAVLGTPLHRPDFVLTDMQGEPFAFRRETEGDVVLLFFGYTHCPDVCPVHMANLAAVLRDLPMEISRRIQVVFVTTDPARDTPERLRAWLGALHPRFIGLTGSQEEIRAAEASVGLAPSVVEEGPDSTGYFVGHGAQVFAFGADGPARVVYPFGVRQRDWLKDLPRLVRETSGDAGES